LIGNIYHARLWLDAVYRHRWPLFRLGLKFIGLPCVRPRLMVFLLHSLPNNDPRPAKPAELALR